MSFIDKGTLFKQSGYVLERNLLSSIEVDYLQEETLSLVKRFGEKHDIESTLPCVRDNIVGAEKTESLQCENVHFYSASYSRLMVDERIVGMATKIMGLSHVQLFGTKVIVKPAKNGSPEPLHQDHVYFPHKNHSPVSAIFFLEDSTEHSSQICVLPDSHKQGALEHDKEGGLHLPFDTYSLATATPIKVQAGDVMFVDYLTAYGMSFNRSPHTQTFIVVTMRDPDDELEDGYTAPLGCNLMIQGISKNF